MINVTKNFNQILELIQNFSTLAHRSANSVRLLAVSKTKPIENIIDVYKAGQRIFGESYAVEAADKITKIKEMGITDIEWHFIGPIQSNKTKLIANNFDVVHSLDRIKIAERLNDQRLESLPKLKVLIQVNISNEEQKSGCNIDEIDNLISYIKTNCPKLELKGFMGVAEDTENKEIIDSQFKVLSEIFNHYKNIDENISELSIGMTNDMDLAIKNGSTMVRIGSAIFGAREYHKNN